MSNDASWKIAECWQQARYFLAQTTDSLDSAISDIQAKEIYLLLCHVLHLPDFSSLLMAWPDLSLSCSQKEAFISLVKRRAEGEPMAYLLGYENFYGQRFLVSPDVLIPRPETEFMVELFQNYRSTKNIYPSQAALANRTFRILDLCCGSGVLALTIKRLYPDYDIYAADICPLALGIAQQNALLQQRAIIFLQSNLLAGFAPAVFDIIVCNPPYLKEADKALMSKDILNFEPHQALFSADDGLAHISQVLLGAARVLKPGGELYLEIGAEQSKAVKAFAETSNLCFIDSYLDFQQIERILLFVRR